MQMMQPGHDSLGASSSFTARRSAASNLPNFELPPPPLAQLQSKYPPYGAINTTSAPSAGSIASVGNLLTPPNTLPSESMTPSSPSHAGNNGNSNAAMHPYNGSGYWQQGPPSAPPYGYNTGSNGQWIPPPRHLFSPTSLNSVVRNGNNTPASSDVVSPSPYEMNQLPPFPASMSMSAPPTLPTMPAHQPSMNGAMMGGQNGVATNNSHPSPVNSQEQYSRHPPTPTYYSQQPPTSASSQQSFQYTAGPSPGQGTPRTMSAQRARISPPANEMQNGPQSPPQYARPYAQYSHPNMPGGVMSNMHSPGGQMALVGGLPSNMMGGYNNGHPANMQHMYGAIAQPPQPTSTPQSDRPFKCDQCVQSFNRNHDLKRHKRIHLAVKPYPCGHCDKSFSRKDALKRHILVKGCGKTARSSDKADDALPGDKVEPAAGVSPPRANRVMKVEA